MRRTTILTVLIAALILFAMATAATAAKPSCKPKDCPADTTTTTEATLWTCQARIDNGANAWDADGDGKPDVEWHETLGVYTASGLPLCFDVRDEHRTVATWEVSWTGTSARATKNGAEALLVFEEQVHENTYADSVVALPSRTATGGDTWHATLTFASSEPRNLVFVAMPRSGARWTSFSVTVEPVGIP